MIVGIYDVYDGLPVPNQKIYETILEYNNIDFIYLNINDDNFWDKLQSVDIVMYKWPNNDNQHLLSNILRPVFESMGIIFFPNTETSWHYDDKIKQYFLMKTHGVDPVLSFIFFNKNKALEFINKTSYPIIAKLKKGASSSNIMLITSKSKAKKYVHKAFSRKGFSPQYYGSFRQLAKNLGNNPKKILKYYLRKYKRILEKRDDALWEKHKNYILFQEYLPGNKYDTRVTTVGNRVHAFRRFARKNDFRASGGEEWDINPNKIDKRMLRIALDFSKKMNFQSMAYDFIYDKNNNPMIVEISNLYGQPGFPDFMNGYWDEKLNRIEGRFWPQYFELFDVLNITELKCPEIDIPKSWLKNTII